MENTVKISDCVEFKNNLHDKLYSKSCAKNFGEYIKYVNLLYSNNKLFSEEKKKETVISTYNY
jgi:hypothetical protein